MIISKIYWNKNLFTFLRILLKFQNILKSSLHNINILFKQYCYLCRYLISNIVRRNDRLLKSFTLQNDLLFIKII